jgi:hypothetical protein
MLASSGKVDMYMLQKLMSQRYARLRNEFLRNEFLRNGAGEIDKIFNQQVYREQPRLTL